VETNGSERARNGSHKHKVDTRIGSHRKPFLVVVLPITMLGVLWLGCYTFPSNIYYTTMLDKCQVGWSGVGLECYVCYVMKRGLCYGF
jgi:hypothetical protein